MRSRNARTLATPTAFGKIREHRRVVGRIADEDEALARGVEIDREHLREQRARHRELVVAAEPAVDVDRAHLRGHALALPSSRRCGRRRRAAAAARPRRSRSRGRSRGNAGRTRGRRPAPRAGCFTPIALSLARLAARSPSSATKRLTSLRRARVVAHVERAVLADDGIDRPHARDVVAPAGRPSGDRNHQHAGGAQARERRIGVRRQLAVRRDRVVDVGQHAAYRAPRRRRHASTAAASRLRRPAPAATSARRGACQWASAVEHVVDGGHDREHRAVFRLQEPVVRRRGRSARESRRSTRRR